MLHKTAAQNDVSLQRIMQLFHFLIEAYVSFYENGPSMYLLNLGIVGDLVNSLHCDS